MTGLELLEKMALVDPAYIEEAEAVPEKPVRAWRKVVALAACVCLLIGMSMVIRHALPSVSRSPVETTSPTHTDPSSATEQTAATTATDPIETEKYTLFWEDGKSYMEHHPGKENESSDDSALRIAHYPTFSSIREMREKLIAGDLAPEEIAELMRYAPEDTNVVEICNINKLYEAEYPENLTMEHIVLYGRGYTYEFGNGDIGNIKCLFRDDYESYFDSEYNCTIVGNGLTVLSVDRVADRNAEVLRYDNFGTEYSRVRYTNETDHGTQYVLEVYKEDTLFYIKIYGMSNGAYYRVYLAYPEERPSLEWISSFGLREYVETEVS